MQRTNILKILLASCLLSTMSCEKSCQKKEDAAEHALGVFFEGLNNNDEVSSPLKVSFGVKGMRVRPALEDVHDKTSGHHHILIDHPMGFIDKGQPIPADPRHIHFGKGETTAIVELPAGTHTLSLQFGDGAHLSYGREMSATITVKVVAPEEKEPDADK